MKVRWEGLDGLVNRDVGAETGAGHVLAHGAEYEVSDELGVTLCRSHVDWTPADADAQGLLDAAAITPAEISLEDLKRPELLERAAALELELPKGNFKNVDLVELIKAKEGS